MKIYNVGIIGFGVMASHHVAQLAKGNVRARISGVFDTDTEKLAEAEKAGFTPYKSAEEMCSDGKIDIVLVSTPNDTHCGYAVAALDAGKHVLVEKPAAMSGDEFAEMIKASEKSGKILAVDQNRRTNRDYVLVRQKTESGIIGTPYLIESYVEGSRGMFGWRCEKQHGGGMLFDWGVHLIDQLLCLTGDEVTRVYCRLMSVHYPQVDDNLRLTLEFSKGLTAEIGISTNAYITHPRWLVSGTDGTMVVENWACDGHIIRAKNGHVGTGEVVSAKAGPTRTMAPRNPSSVERIELSEPVGITDNLDPVYSQFISAIEGGELTITPAQVMRTMKIVDAAKLSSERGEVININI